MIEKIKKLDADKAKELLLDFMKVYLSNGFGTMNKTDIETLIYYEFNEYGLLSGKCFEDSLELRIPETKARKLIYESQIKYKRKDLSGDELEGYLRKSVGAILSHAYISRNGKEIRFAIEDKYLRVALNAKLRSNYYFADTSFNKDIVSLDGDAFCEMIGLLVPNFQQEEVLSKITAVDVKDCGKDKSKRGCLKEIVNAIIVNASVEGLRQLVAALFV